MTLKVPTGLMFTTMMMFLVGWGIAGVSWAVAGSSVFFVASLLFQGWQQKVFVPIAVVVTLTVGVWLGVLR
jgi:hypothetical protein